MYKIFASLDQKRLSHFFDDRIRSTQFSFRAKRSTTQPHIMSRFLEVFECQQNFLHLLFLDWSRALASVTFSAIESALVHFVWSFSFPFSFPLSQYKPIITLIEPQYIVVVHPFFVQSMLPLNLKPATQGTARLFPHKHVVYVKVVHFLLTSSTLFFLTSSMMLNPPMSLSLVFSGVMNTPFPFWDLEYADDTVLLFNSAQQLTRLLHLLQREAYIRDLTLNFDKCAHLRLHSTERASFSSHFSSPCSCFQCSGHDPAPSLVPLSDEVKYLGVFP